MITVLTGTQNMPFGRLVESVIEFCGETNFNQEVCIQAGLYKNQLSVPQNISIFDFAAQEKINELIERSDILITHGGTGSIIGSLGGSRKVIVMPRLVEFCEHNDNHQVEIAELFEKAGHVIYWRKNEEFCDVYSKLESFNPTPYLSGFDDLRKDLLQDIEMYLNG